MQRLITISFLYLSLVSCSSLYFHPLQKHLQSPQDFKLNYEDIWIKSTDGITLHGWWLPSQTPAQGSVYFLHGNAENISTHIASVHWLPAQGYNVFLLDYRGFGKSLGKINLPGAIHDAEAGMAWVLKKTPQEKPVIVLAQSIGTAIATNALARHPEWQGATHTLVLDSGFDNFTSLVKDASAHHWLTTLLRYPILMFVDRRYNTDTALGNIKQVPVLQFHSIEDKIIPFARGQSLFEHANLPKTLIKTRGKHIGTFNRQACRNVLIEHIKDLSSDKPLRC